MRPLRRWGLGVRGAAMLRPYVTADLAPRFWAPVRVEKNLSVLFFARFAPLNR